MFYGIFFNLKQSSIGIQYALVSLKVQYTCKCIFAFLHEAHALESDMFNWEMLRAPTCGVWMTINLPGHGKKVIVLPTIFQAAC